MPTRPSTNAIDDGTTYSGLIDGYIGSAPDIGYREYAGACSGSLPPALTGVSTSSVGLYTFDLNFTDRNFDRAGICSACCGSHMLLLIFR